MSQQDPVQQAGAARSGQFIVFPAIDLRNGEVVRLKEGDPQRQTSYSSNPAQVARRWIDAGARWLHVVNLDGAFEQPDFANRRALDAILAESTQAGVQVQFGGGMRSLTSIEAVLQAGVARVIVGTAVVEQPNLLPEAITRFGADRVGASLDARDGKVQVRGWQSGTLLPVIETAQALKSGGLSWLIFTDITRDGLQTGLNLAATRELAQASGLNIIASGGVRSQEDILNSRAAGLAGVIVGRALYEGTLSPIGLFQ